MDHCRAPRSSAHPSAERKITSACFFLDIISLYLKMYREYSYTPGMYLFRSHRVAHQALPVLLAFAVLWKGGKSLETTWLLVAVAWFAVLASWYAQSQRGSGGARAASDEPAEDVSLGLWFAAIGFAGWTSLSYLTSVTQNYGLDEVLRDGSLAVLFLTGAREMRRYPALRRTLLVIVAASALVAAAIGMPVYILQPVSRFVGTFFDFRFQTDYWPNAWAEFVLLAWPVVLWQAWSASTAKMRGMLMALLGFLLGTLLLSFSRGALLAFAAQLGVGIVCMFITEHRWGGSALPLFRKTAPWMLGVACVMIGVFFLSNAARMRFFDVESVVRKATFTADEGKSSVSERSQFWHAAVTLSRERPLLGYGPYSFRFLQPQLQEGVYETSDHPHNVFLKFAMERGWPAAALFALFFALVLLRALAQIRRGVARHHLLSCLLVLSVLGVLLHNLVDYNLQFVGIALPLMLLLAVLESLHVPLAITGRARKARRLVEVVLLSAFCILAISEGRFLLLSSLGRHSEARGDLAGALAWYETARGQLFSRDLSLSRANIFLQGNRAQDALDALRDYERQNAEDARAWKMRGDGERMLGALGPARDAYEQAYLRGRYNYLSIAEGLLLTWGELGATDAIAEAEDDMMALMGRYAAGIDTNTHFIALSDNVETFLRLSEMLRTYYPEQEAHIDVLAAQVDRSAERERARMEARPPGMLW